MALGREQRELTVGGGCATLVGVAMAGGEDDRVRALAEPERLDPDAEAGALADELEHGAVEPVDDRALQLARPAVGRVLAGLAHEQILGDQRALVMQERQRLREAL